MEIKKFNELNEANEDVQDFKEGDMIIYDVSYMNGRKGDARYIAKVLRSDLPKYQLLHIRIYHPNGVTTDTTISSTYCTKFKEE